MLLGKHFFLFKTVKSGFKKPLNSLMISCFIEVLLGSKHEGELKRQYHQNFSIHTRFCWSLTYLQKIYFVLENFRQQNKNIMLTFVGHFDSYQWWYHKVNNFRKQVTEYLMKQVNSIAYLHINRCRLFLSVSQFQILLCFVDHIKSLFFIELVFLLLFFFLELLLLL